MVTALGSCVKWPLGVVGAFASLHCKVGEGVVQQGHEYWDVLLMEMGRTKPYGVKSYKYLH